MVAPDTISGLFDIYERQLSNQTSNSEENSTNPIGDSEAKSDPTAVGITKSRPKAKLNIAENEKSKTLSPLRSRSNRIRIAECAVTEILLND